MFLDRPLLLLLRNTLLLALVGVGLVLAGGVLLSLLGVVLVFALLGFLVWLPLHTLFRGPNPVFGRCWTRTKSYCTKLTKKYRQDFSPLTEQWERTWQRARTGAGRVGIFLVEMLSGGLIGGLLALLCRPEFSPGALAIGIGLGLAVGTLVALQRTRT